jgi:hypothetical protein
LSTPPAEISSAPSITTINPNEQRILLHRAVGSWHAKQNPRGEQRETQAEAAQQPLQCTSRLNEQAEAYEYGRKTTGHQQLSIERRCSAQRMQTGVQGEPWQPCPDNYQCATGHASQSRDAIARS